MDFTDIIPHILFMTALLFDMLRLSRTLQEKGHFTSEQAEALAQAFGEATHDDLATKADFAVLEAALKAETAIVKAEIGSVKAEMANLATKAELAEVRAGIAAVKAEIAGVRADILKWVVGAIGFQTAAMLGTVVALVRIFAK
jgi:hypothetical protein